MILLKFADLFKKLTPDLLCCPGSFKSWRFTASSSSESPIMLSGTFCLLPKTTGEMSSSSSHSSSSESSVTISFHAYHIRTHPTFSYTNPWCHTDITMTSSPLMTSFLHHYDLTSYLWPHLSPLWHHHQNPINTIRYRNFNLTCSYLVTW